MTPRLFAGFQEKPMNPAGWQAPAKAEEKSWRAHREIKGYAGSSEHCIVADEREYATGTGAADESDSAGGTNTDGVEQFDDGAEWFAPDPGANVPGTAFFAVGQY
jgi:hypothetical protein